MAKVIKGLTAGSFLLTVVFGTLWLTGSVWADGFAITFGTFFYHFAMRLLVGYGINAIMGSKADLCKGWYQPRPFEARLYKALKVKKWKATMPTYVPDLFNPKQYSWEKIAQAMCQAELVHEVIIVLSFVPLLAAIPFGAFPVFLITSILSSLFDLSFVVMQRYNRPRIIKLINKERTVK